MHEKNSDKGEIEESEPVETGCICGPILRGVARPRRMQTFQN